MNGDNFVRNAASELPPDDPNIVRGSDIEVACYEAPGGRGPGSIYISEEALFRHVLVMGATGAGKSTLLRSIMCQLISGHCSDVGRRAGLVILDFKRDDTADQVRRAATAAGRLSDVRILSLESHVGYDFFSGCKSVAEATEFAQRLCFASGVVSAVDGFWDGYRQSCLSAAIVWLVLNHSESRSFSNWITHAASWLLADTMPSELRDDLRKLRERHQAMSSGSPERIATGHAIQLIDSWESGMDFRTRANVRATLQIALTPLLEPAALRLFRSSPLKKFRVRDAIEKGLILVVSINSFLHPELASLVGKCVKADFYKSVFERQGGRAAFLIGDEYHLTLTSGNPRYDDCHALPLLRSHRAGVIAATQTLAGIDRQIGNLGRRVLLGNFGTAFFLRSTERETNEWATQVCGVVEETVTKSERVRDMRASGQYAEDYERSVTGTVRRAVCGPGDLARLETGQAYLLQEGTKPSPYPVWIADGTRADDIHS